MTNKQLLLIFTAATCYLFSSIVIWGLYCVYLLLTGQA